MSGNGEYEGDATGGARVCVRGNVSVCLSVCESVSVSMRIHVSVCEREKEYVSVCVRARAGGRVSV